ncbi:MAG: hypothetical protein RMI91_10775 [Gemmatales bacterium]|nr:hypothetical protein [Gemmatales bacterium]MDW7995125.1 hypothetical protein [Gemmatales bacterium]
MAHRMTAIVMFLCWAVWGWGLAQEKPADTKPGGGKPEKPFIAPTAETLRLKLPELRRTDMSELARLRTGDPDFNLPEAERKELLQRVAQYYIFRLTHETPLYTESPLVKLKGGGIEASPDFIREHMNQFATRVLPLPRSLEGVEGASPEVTRRIRQYASELATVSVPLILKVLQDPRPIVRLNAMRMAYLFAERGIGEIYPVLVFTFEKYPIDASAVYQAERYWAIRGFGELFHARMTNKDPKRVILPEDLAIKAAGLLYDWLTWAYRIDPAQVKTWAREEQDGLRFLRRQALRSLAMLRRSVVNPANPQQQRIAELLMQVMSDEDAAKLSPRPSWSERVEAAAGLLALVPEPKGPYQADRAFYEVGRFVVALLEASSADTEGLENWQHYAAYLRSRILEAQQNAAYQKNDYITKIIPTMLRPLDELSRIRAVEAFKRISTRELEQFLTNNPPKATALFVQPRS